MQIQKGTQVGDYAPDFELPGVDQVVHHLFRYLEEFQAIAVIVMCNHCPYVQSYIPRLNQLQQELQPQGVTLIGINGNDDHSYPEDSFDNMKVFAKEKQLAFPYLRDTTQDVIRSLGAVCTPEAFLLDQQGVLRYRGAIDDMSQQLRSVKHHYLQDAIAQVLAGQPVAHTATPAVGCSVKWRH